MKRQNTNDRSRGNQGQQPKKGPTRTPQNGRREEPRSPRTRGDEDTER